MFIMTLLLTEVPFDLSFQILPPEWTFPNLHPPPLLNIAIRYVLVEIFETKLNFYTNHYLRKITAAPSIENFNSEVPSS